MKLRSLEIKNYRSLESVELQGIHRFNVLIGRNNSGKSSVFGAIQLFSKLLTGATGDVDWDGVLTSKDSTKSFEIAVVFETNAAERKELIDWLRVPAGSGAGDRHDALINSPAFRQISFRFKAPPGAPHLLHLRETRLIAEDNGWSVIQEMTGDEREGNPISRVTRLTEEVQGAPNEPFSTKRLDCHHSSNVTDMRFSINLVSNFNPTSREPIFWPHHRLLLYLQAAFFFNPFRHSGARLPAQETSILAQDGSNLAQVLDTISGNNRPLFGRIEKFMQAALPDVGTLQAPRVGNMTEVGFRSPDEKYLVRLHDMGGGVEQLLMIATVLLTTDDESTIFVEEPESHLHPGAQRFLIERLAHGERQVFLTTHSPIFVNVPDGGSIFRVGYIASRTTITHLQNTEPLQAVLRDIGSRNSDLLLSDAVLFVEGPSDADSVRAWSEILKMSLAEHNVAIISMGGGEDLDRTGRVRSEVLEGISQRAPVKHLFVIDRDERRRGELLALSNRLGSKIHIFARRELENYLLVPRAILAAASNKYIDNKEIRDRVNKTSADEVDRLISETVANLYGLVLLKRIRAEVRGPRSGLFPRAKAKALASEWKNPGLHNLIAEAMREGLKGHLKDMDIRKIGETIGEELALEWRDEGRRSGIVPGAEILEAVFQRFGGAYEKAKDAVRIAREMNADEIPEEIRELVGRTVTLSGGGPT